MKRPKSGGCNEQATKLWLQSTMRTSELTVYTPSPAPSLLHLISCINELASNMNHINGFALLSVVGKDRALRGSSQGLMKFQASMKSRHVCRLAGVKLPGTEALLCSVDYKLGAIFILYETRDDR